MRFKLKNKVAIMAIAGASCLVLGGAGVALSQSSLEDLVRGAEKRAEAFQSQVKDLTSAAIKKSEEYQGEASDLTTQNKLAMKKAVPFMKNGLPFQYDEALLGGSETVNTDNGAVYIAVSFSMPVPVLKQLAADAKKAKAVLVIQGPVHGSFKETMAAAAKVFANNESGEGVQIDPRVFKQYHIDRVPAFISAPEGVPDCEENGLECQRPDVPFDVVKGNISLKAALMLLADRGTAAPDVAKRALSNLNN